MTGIVVQPVRILGVCSSPRRASTLYCLEQALREAEKVPGVQTTLLVAVQQQLSF